MKFAKDSELCLAQSFEKYLSRIHAGTDILFTDNDALWYRTVLKL